MKATNNNTRPAHTLGNTLLGYYEFISPYHRRKTILPFDVYRRWLDGSYQVRTVEYKGRKRMTVDETYTEQSILTLINKKTIALARAGGEESND